MDRFACADAIALRTCFKARPRYGNCPARNIQQCTAPEWRVEPVLRRAIAQRLTFFRCPVLHEIPCGIERGLIVKEADPERRQPANTRPGATICAAHLDIVLHASLGKDR